MWGFELQPAGYGRMFRLCSRSQLLPARTSVLVMHRAMRAGMGGGSRDVVVVAKEHVKGGGALTSMRAMCAANMIDVSLIIPNPGMLTEWSIFGKKWSRTSGKTSTLPQHKSQKRHDIIPKKSTCPCHVIASPPNSENRASWHV